ncbi:MerR family transcriptional regulator [Haloferula sargassicola]|uniref:HTH merR-type domain-containing protein n=1 Tax=Haloferula sargassicola TaxID=490096 RepID=A0ABP9ULD5_9BACT
MNEENLYDISAVSRLTGLSSPNLRVWESRYGLVHPTRSSSNRRLYSEDDVRRLTLAKTLSDRGHPLASIARLSADEMEARLQDEARLSGSTHRGLDGGACRCVLIGGEILGLLDGRESQLEKVRIVGRFQSMEEARRGFEGGTDLLLIATPTLFPETVEAIRSLLGSSGALRAVVAYRFAPSGIARNLEKDFQPITAIRSPIEMAELRVVLGTEITLIRGQAATASMGAAAETVAPPRRFSDEELARISRISTTIDCECPHHLAELLGMLNAFARYSEECENRNEDDARMHAYLHLMTCRARSLVEESLAELIRFESITLD